MKNFLQAKTQYYKSFADSMQKKFMQVRFGVKSCSVEQDLLLSEIRKEIVDWQQNNDGNALTDVSINYITDLDVDYTNGIVDSEYFDGGIGSINGSCCSAPLQSFRINKSYAGHNANLVEVNTGGCITKINLNSNINIDGAAFVFIQGVASTTWHIVHNLGFTPNVFTKNDSGIPIEGIITIVDINTIDINFSSPVSGIAYLS